MDNITIRTVSPDDAEELLDIYSYYVSETAVSFEYDPPTTEEFRARIEKTLRKYPYLAAVSGGRIVGYAYAGAFSERPAYSRCVELSVYVRRGFTRNGIGRMLYAELEKILKKMGILNLYALISIPADEEDEYLTSCSIDFHEQIGFVRVGLLRDCGLKFDRWYDVVIAEKLIGEHNGDPAPLLTFGEV